MFWIQIYFLIEGVDFNKIIQFEKIYVCSNLRHVRLELLSYGMVVKITRFANLFD